ncbi:MAG TPA: phage Gp37/Gp68 family protein [Gemmatimonadaceae bacterium]
MGTKTGIAWTDATWNPIRGCSRVSAGCQHCYAESVAARFSGPGLAYEGLARRRSNGEPQWTGDVRVIDEHMADPLRWRSPRRVFVNSMSDLFHENVSEETMARVFAVMALSGAFARGHVFQILTKRPRRMLDFLTRPNVRQLLEDHAGEFAEDGDCHVANAMNDVLGEGHNVGWPLRNVWLGVSVEHQAAADERIPLLLETPAAIRFLSCEPLLGSVDLSKYGVDERKRVQALKQSGTHELMRTWVSRLDWVIVGGESGRHARPMELDWARRIRHQCARAGTAFFLKQLGGFPDPHAHDKAQLDGRMHTEFPERAS